MRNSYTYRHTRPLLALGVMLVLILSGCTRGTEDVHRWVAQEKDKKGSPPDPLPSIKTFETFEYKDHDLRDPFSPSRQEQLQEIASANTGPHPDQNRPKEPLEAFTLDALKMVGTIGIVPKIEGLIKDPDGVIHRVHTNEYLGQNYGKILGIGEDHIELVELVPNGAGGWIERQASIALGDK